MTDMHNDRAASRQSTIAELLRGPTEEGELLGAVERIVFENKDTGFIVARLKPEGQTHAVTIVGNALPVSPGETVRLRGRWIDDKKFGRQFRVEHFETIRPSSADAIEKYLGSGLIEGIGPQYAKKIVAAFGVDTLRVIDEEPERLRRVPGIGAKRAKQIRDAWSAQRAVQSIMLFLQGHGIPPSLASRIYKQYGDAAVAVLRDNPYRLADDVTGISFKTSDAIAQRMGVDTASPKRVGAALRHVLREATGDGHCYLEAEELAEEVRRLMNAPNADIAAVLDDLCSRKEVIREGDAVFLPRLHAAECGVDQWLKRIVSVPADSVSIDAERAIRWVESTKSIELSPEQREAVRTAVHAKVAVITGGPGTGKTTLLNGLLDIFSKKKLNIVLGAPTGRAAKRMAEATGRDAATIHRVLEWSPKQGGFLRHEGNPLAADVLVLDECSMVDVYLMHSVLRAVPPQCRVILVGDVDQLPSVGPGNVLMDIIASNIVPVVRLQTVFRQAAESGIVSNAHRINTGQFPQFNDRDFFFVERTDPIKAMETIIEIATARLPKRFHLDPIRDIQVLPPMHRGDAGVTRLNEALRDALNPNAPRVGQRAFGLRDKVMQTRNNYDLEVFNGDVGIVTQVLEDQRRVIVEFDGRPVAYDDEQLDELTLAYASTVHKAQGSEYPAVVVPMLTQHFMMLQRNVLYTAITRASRIVVMVGDRRSIGRAVHNVRSTRRNTRLSERLQNKI